MDSKKTLLQDTMHEQSEEDITQLLNQQFVKYVEKKPVDSKDKPQPKESDIHSKLADITKKDHEALNDLLVATLAPQLKENEIQKRKLKERISKYILWAIIIQSILVFFPVISVVFCICFDFPFLKVISIDDQQIVFNFLEYFITAVLAEFIAMLFFIVKQVFDKSIVGLTQGLLNNSKTDFISHFKRE